MKNYLNKKKQTKTDLRDISRKRKINRMNTNKIDIKNNIKIFYCLYDKKIIILID